MSMKTKDGKKRIACYVIGALLAIAGYYLYNSDDFRWLSYFVLLAAIVIPYLGKSSTKSNE
tara:strand:- start:537 stop:719 length:183 start_codon:yes stop_codon:yes gene_type:complete